MVVPSWSLIAFWILLVRKCYQRAAGLCGRRDEVFVE
jgi:hypothetical protein